MGVAGKLYKYIFPIVDFKFSGVAIILGYITALALGYDGVWLPWGHSIPSWLVFLLVFLGDIVGEGMWQHGFDILNDKTGGVSGFREEGPLAEKLARAMVYSAFIILLFIAGFTVLAGRVLLVPVGLVAVYYAYKYSKKRHEAYPCIAVAMAAMAGWLSATNNPFDIGLLVAILISVISSKTALVLYRYDDYKGINTWPEFSNDWEVMAYYREYFWIVMWEPYLAGLLLLSVMGYKLLVGILVIPVLLELYHRRRAFCHEGK